MCGCGTPSLGPRACGGRLHVRVTGLVGCVVCDPGMALLKRAKLQSNPIQTPPHRPS